MALPFQDRFAFLREGTDEHGSRNCCRLLAVWLFLLLAIGVGCMGGQTGTEATDDRDEGPAGGGGTSDVDTGGTVGSDGTASPDPVGEGFDRSCAPLGEDSRERTAAAIDQASAWLTKLEPMRIVDQAGTEWAALLSIRDAGAACEAPIGGGPSELRVAVTIELSAMDGSFLLSFPGTAQFTTGTDGSLWKLELAGSRQCSGAPGSAAMLPCAWGTFDARLYTDALLKLDVTVQSVASRVSLLGSLSAYVREQPCDESPCAVSSEPQSVVSLTAP
jgi:hypothetical protein